MKKIFSTIVWLQPLHFHETPGGKKQGKNYERILLWRNPRSSILPPISSIYRRKISKTCWRSKDELISDVPLLIPTNWHNSVDRPAQTQIHQLYADTGCRLVSHIYSHYIHCGLSVGHDGNYTRMLRAILNKFRQQHPTRHQLYGHLPPITKTIQARRTRHAGHCWRSKGEFISDVLLWTPHMAKQKQNDQLEHTYSSYVRIRDVALKTCRRRWTIGRGGERGCTTWWWWWYALSYLRKCICNKQCYIYIYIYGDTYQERL